MPTPMIYPRNATPDRVLKISRRTLDRRKGMIPRIGIALIQLFIMLRAATETGVRLHAFSFLMDGYDMVVSDNAETSRVCEFVERMNRHLARVFNAINGTRGYFWDSDPTEIIELLDRDAVLDAMVETLTSARRAGLASRVGGWLGLECPVDKIGAAATRVPRPSRLGRGLPKSLEFKVVKPKFFEDMDAAEFRELVRAEVRSESLAIRRSHGRRGLRTQAPGAIVNANWRDVTTPPEINRIEREERRRGSQFRGALPLCVAAEAALAAFQAAYRAVWKQWSRGRHDVLFPIGTYQVCRHHAARVVPAT